MRCRRAWVALALMACAGAAWAQSPATVRGPWRLDEGTTATVQDVYLAASNPSVVSAAWITSDGFAPGIYLRNRSPLGIWQPIMPIKGNVGGQPRDLAMAHDDAGRLYMVWTALEDGRRRLHFARSDTPALVTPASPLPLGDSAEAQFPAIAEAPGVGMILVWQSESTTSTTIRAAALRENAPPADLGVVSGASHSAMAPQIISTRPLRVAWYQIDEIGGRVAVNEWDNGRWRAATMGSLAGLLPQIGNVTLRAEADTLAAGWQEPDPAGIGKIALEVLGRANAATTESTKRVMFETPPGEHTQLSLDGSPLGRLTVAWRNFVEAGQEIRMRSIDVEGRQSESVALSPASQRFAGRVDQVTIGDWSVAAWTDVARDGGHGGVYVSELNWQTPAGK